jgi:hypothetical protein
MAALPLAPWARIAPAYRPVFCYAAYLAGGLPFLAVVYGATVGRLRYRVVPVEVPIMDLPPQLDGLRIVHLSDIHRFTPYFGEVLRGLVSPVLLCRGDTHGYAVSACHGGTPPPLLPALHVPHRGRCCDAPP